MDMAHAKALIGYNQWAHQRVWDCIATLDDEQFVRDVGYSWGSIRAQVVHVMSVDRRWFARLQGGRMPDHLKPEDFATQAAVRDTWDQIQVGIRQTLADLDERHMNHVLTYDMPHRGGIKSSTAAEIIAHVVNHGTDHRAQILAMLHMLGAPTVEQDMMFYFWERGGQAQ